MHLKLITICVFVTIATVACKQRGSKKIVIDGFNSNKWKQDSLGCLGFRSEAIEILLKSSVKLQSSQDNDIIEILGRPNRVRNNDTRTTFFYFVEPGRQCDSSVNLEYADVMTLYILVNKRNIVEKVGITTP